MSDDPKFDDMISREAKGYRADSTPPADAMWARIQPDVAEAIQPVRRIGPRWSWIAAGAGIAAALVLGVAIGRRSVETGGQPRQIAATTGLSAAAVDSVRDAQTRAVTLNHFAQAEMFLTEVRADLTSGRQDPARADRSRELLARTRLIMASSTGRAPAVEQLLQDLELVLAGIAALPDSGARRPAEVQLLDERIRVGGVLPRIRTILPSPPSTGGDDS